MVENDILRVSISEEEINKMVEKVANQINEDYKDKCPLIICILKGAVPFMTDLLKKINIYCTLDYMRVKSYDGTVSTGDVKIFGVMPKLAGKDVIIVEDIFDTGKTLVEIKNLFIDMNAKSIKTCVLLDKPEGRIYDITADYVGGNVPNEFVVGYGLDYNEKYRNLPYIGVLKEEVYKK